MRCGKEVCIAEKPCRYSRNPHECAVAKMYVVFVAFGSGSRNPHECAVAKSLYNRFVYTIQSRNPHECAVAKDTLLTANLERAVATRTNALWQRINVIGTMNTLKRRNPHECAVAKKRMNLAFGGETASQPARMR